MWSRDGKTLYFVSDRSGAPNLWTRAASGGAERQLTKFTDGRVLWPTISNDGKRSPSSATSASGATTSRAGTASRSRSRCAAPRGRARRASHAHGRAAGARPLARWQEGRLHRARKDLRGIEPRRRKRAARVERGLTEQQPAWAPDSRRLAFGDDRDGHFNLYVYDFVTHEERSSRRAARTMSRRVVAGRQVDRLRARRQRAARVSRRSESEADRADGSRRGARAARSRALSLGSRDRLVARRQVDRVCHA